MAHRRLDEQQIESTGRLLLAVSHTRLKVALAAQLTELAREVDMPMPTRATAAGDVAKLRGIPAVGRGVPGAIRGSRPDMSYGIDEITRTVAALVVDIDGTSPGSQPEEALLAKEAESG